MPFAGLKRASSSEQMAKGFDFDLFNPTGY
jgi:hypothetical protein